MNVAVAVVLVVVGVVLFPFTYRLHKRHPEWAWNIGPAAWLYVLASALLAFGLVGLLVSV